MRNKFWFVSFREAFDWLAYDASAAEMEVACAREPDRFLEWSEWADTYEAAGEPDDLDTVVVALG